MSTYTPFPLQLKRQFARPIDPDSVFQTNADMQAYLSDPLRYAGMVVSCLESEGAIFILNNARNQWLNTTDPGIKIIMVGGDSGYIEANEHGLGSNIQVDFFFYNESNTLSPINIYYEILSTGRIYWKSNIVITNGCAIIK